MLSIVNANYKDDFKIVIEFSDHKMGEVDLKDFIFNGKIIPFKKLQDVEKFKNFHVDYTLMWEGDLDLAPEYLYYKAFEQDASLKNKFHEWGYV